MEIPGLTAGAIFLLLLTIIGWFIKQTIASKDTKIEAQDNKLVELTKEYARLEIIVVEFKGTIANLGSDVRENRVELIKALGAVKDFISVNEKIEKQLERSNVLHEDLKDLIKRIVEVRYK